MFASLIKQRDQNHIEIEKIDDTGLSINQIVDLLDKHFEQSQSYGKSRLPVLAIHSIYRLLIPQLKRYEDTILQDLSSHTSADVRHGDIGDIQVNDSSGEPFEAIEVKYGIKISPSIVLDAYNKFKTTKVKRYYVLSTVNVDINELQEINTLIKDISEEHGCQVIVNGLLGTLKYYLRLIEDTTEFLNLYTDAVLADKVIKTSHKKLWKNLININN
jgi:DNA (cytosine-5)-methyltransferase 1